MATKNINKTRVIKSESSHLQIGELPKHAETKLEKPKVKRKSKSKKDVT
jgi:hypothetical protein